MCHLSHEGTSLKKTLSSLHRNRFITLLGLVSAIAACKDSNVGFTGDVDAINTKDLTAFEDDLQVENQDGGDAEAARRPAFDTEEILKQLIDKDREESIERDNDNLALINENKARIDALEKRLDDFEKHVLAEIERLDAKDAQQDKDLLNAKNDYAQKIDQLAQDISKDLDKAINELDANMRAENEAKLKALEESLNKKRDDLKKQIATVIEALATAAQAAINDLNNSIVELAEQQQADKKALLEKLAAAEQAAMDAVEAEKDSRIAEALAIKKELEELEAVQNVKMKDLKDQLDKAFNEIDGNKDDIAKNKAAISQLQEDLINAENAAAEERAKLKTEMEKNIASMEEKLKAYVNNVVEDTEAKLNEARANAIEQIRKDHAEEIENAKAEAKASNAALSKEFEDKLKAQGEEIKGTIAEVVKALEDKVAAETAAREAKVKELEDALGENAKADIKRHQDLVKTIIINQINVAIQIVALKKSHDDKIKELEEKINTVDQDAKAALEAEKLARQAEIAALDKDLQKSKEEAEAARAQMDKELKDSIANESAETKAKFDELKSELDALDDDLHAAQLELQKQMHEQEIRTRDKIDEKVGDLEDKVREDYAKLEGQIKEVAEDLQNFKEEVAQTYATKAELAKVKAYADGIKEATNILGKKIDENDVALRHLISEEVKNTKAELSKKISEVEANVEDLKGDFQDHLGDYEKTVADLSGKIDDSIEEIKEDMLQMRGDFVEDHKALKQSLTEKLEAGLANFEVVTQQLKKEFADKIVAVEGAIDVTNQKLVEAKEEAKKRLKEAMEHEEKKRKAIQDSMDKMLEELEDLRQLAEDTQALAEANSDNIAQLRKDFEAEKKAVAAKFQVAEEELDKKLAAMKDDYEQKIQEVSDKSAELVANLGADVQKNMRNLTTNMADLNQKVAANKAAFDKFMDDFHSNEQAKADFRKGMREGKEKVVPGLENLIHAISEMELVFLQVINPDQNNLPFYNETFKPIMMRCEGNSKATFANALGRDSFQFLAQEYTRQLVHGIEVAKWGGIFHGDGKKVDMGDLQGLLVLDTTRYKVGSDQEECVVDIETWGRHTLFSNTKDSQDLRKTIEGSVDLARAVQKVKGAINDLAGPSGDVEAVIKKALEGKANADDNFKKRLPKVVAKIVEAAG